MSYQTKYLKTYHAYVSLVENNKCRNMAVLDRYFFFYILLHDMWQLLQAQSLLKVTSATKQ